MTWISLIISILVGLYCFYRQWTIYKQNDKRLDELQSLLPDNIDAYYLKDVQDTKEICVKSSEVSEDFTTLIGELNEYSRKNIGTTDFAIIQNKTERYVKMQYDNAVSKVAFPTYIGLMGTFCGVFIGLLFFSLGSSSLGNDDKVYQLIYGVLVSMSTSFCGLYLTTKANSKSAETKKLLDQRKNIFYDFIQNDMMPAMGTSMVVALTKLRETLGTFEPAFGRIIGSFKNTFDECTSQFGEKFNVTVKAVTDAARVLGSSIEAVNDNVKHQKELLDEIRSGEMMIALNSFLEACDALEASSNTLNSFIDSTKKVEESTQSLVATQLKYTSALVVPQTIAEKLNAILDRITTFEESINNLGVALDQTELVSNKTIASIEQHLQSVQAKNNIAEAYVETGNDQLKDLFEDHKKAIDSLHHGYVSLLAEHQANLETTMEAIGTEMMKARNLLMTKLSTAFDLLSIKGEFAHLSQLPEINQHLDELQKLVFSLPPEVGKLVAEHIAKEYQALDGLATTIQQNAQQTNRELSDVKQKQNGLSESFAQTSSSISNQLSTVKQSLNDGNDVLSRKLDSVIDSTSDKMEQKFKSVEEKTAMISEAITALTPKVLMISTKSDAINEKIQGIDNLAEQIDKVKAEVEALIVFNEENPAERLELGSLANLGKMIDTHRKKVDEAIQTIESKNKEMAKSHELSNLECKLQTLSSVVQRLTNQLEKNGKNNKNNKPHYPQDASNQNNQ